MSIKKIGIITFHNADNLGAVLQAYALQRVLSEELGVDVEIIDYRCSGIEGDRKNSSGIKGLALRGYYFIKHRAFQRFRRQHLKLSSKYTPQTIAESVYNYDAFITGSDQVWNYECSNWDDAYFLDFVDDKKKKYSYAASLGNYRYSGQEYSHIQKLLRNFSYISVREESAKQELKNLGIDRVLVHPDPVVLLAKERWLNIAPRRLCKQRYIFVYLIQQDVNVVSSALKYAKKHHYKVINNKTSPEFILHGSPADFLSWVYYADCVFTNSFHGTAFSLIFNKPLAADIELINDGINHRVKEMLEATSARQCILDKENIIANVPKPEDALENMRKEAYLYLREVCENL